MTGHNRGAGLDAHDSGDEMQQNNCPILSTTIS